LLKYRIKRNSVAFDTALCFTPAVQNPSISALSREDMLRQAGVKVTQPRLRVLSCLLEAQAALSHTEIEAVLSAEGTGELDRVTLYRVLDSLVGCGIASRSLDARGVFRFMLKSVQLAHAEHAHFHCQRCGRVFCVESMHVPAPSLPAGFVGISVVLEISGLCPPCASPE
jgi:Fur family transcriptional regulator, ferric uptake regulator